MAIFCGAALNFRPGREHCKGKLQASKDFSVMHLAFLLAPSIPPLRDNLSLRTVRMMHQFQSPFDHIVPVDELILPPILPIPGYLVPTMSWSEPKSAATNLFYSTEYKL
ncbi:hypothetical protein CIHG_08861 [Coccidioides immitis H538.4]|uniref:Uncharacterized protein n=3 Tax=Coccidioides TaxID=5500 RepID=A0A0J8QNS4_COCIT|nr:hypothetical protein CPAG_06089 [Coccidioides posadasii RMSCC 3488]KMU72928.1 hypothetical protein CISG_09860 [Coccidioides immitis RMSCC 3703]KMU91193.1 hypothetical protein CIHG_08861 [Coccidioides immitis H538.4]